MAISKSDTKVNSRKEKWTVSTRILKRWRLHGGLASHWLELIIYFRHWWIYYIQNLDSKLNKLSQLVRRRQMIFQTNFLLNLFIWSIDYLTLIYLFSLSLPFLSYFQNIKIQCFPEGSIPKKTKTKTCSFPWNALLLQEGCWDGVSVRGVTHDLFHLCFSYIIQFHQWVCSKGLHLALSGLLPIMLPIIIVLVGALLSIQTHTCASAPRAPSPFDKGIREWYCGVFSS